MDSSLFRWGEVGDCDVNVRSCYHPSSDEKDPDALIDTHAALFDNYDLTHPKSCSKTAFKIQASNH